MADKKITQLTEMNYITVVNDDVITIVDVSAGTSHKIRIKKLIEYLSVGEAPNNGAPHVRLDSEWENLSQFLSSFVTTQDLDYALANVADEKVKVSANGGSKYLQDAIRTTDPALDFDNDGDEIQISISGNSIKATHIAVSGNGTPYQVLASAGNGLFQWHTIPLIGLQDGNGIIIENGGTAQQKKVTFKPSTIPVQSNPIAANIKFPIDYSGNGRLVSFQNISALILSEQAFMYLDPDRTLIKEDTATVIGAMDIFASKVTLKDGANAVIPITNQNQFTMVGTNCTPYVDDVLNNEFRFGVHQIDISSSQDVSVTITHIATGANATWFIEWLPNTGPIGGGGVPGEEELKIQLVTNWPANSDAIESNCVLFKPGEGFRVYTFDDVEEKYCYENYAGADARCLAPISIKKV